MNKRTPSKTRRCIVCNERKAKVLEVSFRQKGKLMEYSNSCKEPVFCSKNCAAAWALLWVFIGEDPLDDQPEHID